MAIDPTEGFEPPHAADVAPTAAAQTNDRSAAIARQAIRAPAGQAGHAENGAGIRVSGRHRKTGRDIGDDSAQISSRAEIP